MLSSIMSVMRGLNLQMIKATARVDIRWQSCHEVEVHTRTWKLRCVQCM